MKTSTPPTDVPAMFTVGLLSGIVTMILSWMLIAGGQNVQASTTTPQGDNQRTGIVLPEHHSGERNAALDLWRLWDVIGHLAIRQIHDGYDSDPAWTPQERVLNTLIEIETSTDDIVRVSRLPLCDFQPRYEDGVSMLLPHLAKMRSSAVILASDARRLTETGRHDKAAERIEGIIRIAGHSSSDRVLIGALVGAAILNLAKDELVRLNERGGLTEAGKAQILVALEQATGLERDDPLRFKQSITSERDVFLGGLKNMLRGDDASDMLAMLGATTIQSAMMRAMTDAAIETEIEKGRLFYNEVLEAWDAPDAQERLAELESRVAQRRDGLFTALMAPAITKTHASYRNTKATLSEMRAMVQSEAPR